MSDAAAPDPYATAKANLRDTIKWLATSLAAVGAAVIAGASINGLAQLEGSALVAAAVLGGIGLLAILLAIAVMVALLTSNVFYFSQLSEAGNAIAAQIDRHASDILSPQTPTIASLVEFRRDAVDKMKAAGGGGASYQDAYKRWTAANDLIARVTNLAQFLSLRNDFERKQRFLFGATVVVILALGGYAILVGGKSGVGADPQRRIVFRPGTDWGEAAKSLTKECGSDPLSGTMTSKKTFEGWVTVRLSQPGKCGGLELSVPASLVQLN